MYFQVKDVWKLINKISYSHSGIKLISDHVRVLQNVVIRTLRYYYLGTVMLVFFLCIHKCQFFKHRLTQNIQGVDGFLWKKKAK